MPEFHRPSVSLRIASHDLVPEQLTALLGCKPSLCQSKGEVFPVTRGRKERIAPIGVWILDAPDRDSGSLSEQIERLFADLNLDPEVWSELHKRYDVSVICGIFMQSGIEGGDISPTASRMLADKGVRLQIDVYAGDSEEQKAAQPGATDNPDGAQ